MLSETSVILSGEASASEGGSTSEGGSAYKGGGVCIQRGVCIWRVAFPNPSGTDI